MYHLTVLKFKKFYTIIIIHRTLIVDARGIYKKYCFEVYLWKQPKKLVFHRWNCQVYRYYKKNHIKLRSKRIKASLLLRWFCRLRIEIISRNNFIRWSVWFFQEICIPTDSLRISNNVFIKWYYGAVLYKMIYFFALIEKCNKKSGKNYKKSLAIFIVICYNVYKAVA